MHVYFSTVMRGAPVERGGELVRLNWKTKTVEAKTPIFPENPAVIDPNPRGNARGARGIEVRGDDVIVASYHTLKVFDRDLNPRRDISHPLMVGLHETYLDSGGAIWVCSTALDCALRIDLDTGEATRQIWPRELTPFQEQLHVAPLEIDKSADNRIRFLSSKHIRNRNHLHLNTVAEWRGEMYGLFNSFGVIANLDREQIVVRDAGIKGAHNLVVLDDGTVMLSETWRAAVVLYDLNTGSLIRSINLKDFPWVQNMERRYRHIRMARSVLQKLGLRTLLPSAPLLVRGMDRAGGSLFVGLSPASIIEIDWQKGTLIDVFSYSRDVRICVHGIKVVAE